MFISVFKIIVIQHGQLRVLFITLIDAVVCKKYCFEPQELKNQLKAKHWIYATAVEKHDFLCYNVYLLFTPYILLIMIVMFTN